MLAKSYHFQQVENFMLRAGQKVPVVPTLLTKEERLLRAKLMVEECLETVHALGVDITTQGLVKRIEDGRPCVLLGELKFYADDDRRPDFIQIIDGCLDTRVVTTGTLVAMGVPDAVLQDEVDNNNLLKFGPGGYLADGSKDRPGPIGKWMKPMNHPEPRISHLLHAMFPNADLDSLFELDAIDKAHNG